MADYHILDGDMDGEGLAYSVAFHVSVPDEDNVAGVNIRVAVSQDPEAGKASIVPWISEPEQTSLTNGELYEVVKTYARKAGNTLVQDRAALDAKFTASVPVIQNKLRDRYKFWGFDRDLP